MPDEVVFGRVPQCQSGRVFYLEFTGSAMKHFFWLQDADSSKDAAIFRQLVSLVGQAPETFEKQSDSQSQ